MSKPHVTITESIGYGREPGELKHLSSRRKRKKTIDFQSSGERNGKSPNRRACMSGFGLHNWSVIANRTVLERPAREGESPVSERWGKTAGSRVLRDTRNLVGKSGDHPVRLNTTQWPIEHSTVKERWKEPRVGEWKSTWNLVFTNSGSTLWVRPRTFCRTVRRVILTGEVKHLRCGAEGKPSLNRAKVSGNIPETGWSTHVQVEAGVKSRGGPNTHPLKRVVMRCG